MSHSDPGRGTLISRFEQQVLRSPGATAVIGGDGDWTYARLGALSNAIAERLHEATGDQPQPQPQPIVTYLRMGPLQLAALLGILKSGHFYVPLEPGFPAERNRHCARHCGARLLLTDAGHGSEAGDFSLDTLLVSAEDRAVATPPDRSSADGIAFIIYTSGSSGQPKGVYFDHDAVLHQVTAYSDALAITPDDRLSCLYSGAVIGAMRDIYGALLNGAALWPFDPGKQGLRALYQGLRDNRITFYNSVATLYRHLLDELQPGERLPDCRLVRLGGEMSLRRDVERMAGHFPPQCRFLCGFGLSETGTITQHFPSRSEPLPDQLPSGHVVAGMEVLVLDEQDNPLHAGEQGEIAARGPYLARGYWKAPELTRARFIPDPLGSDQPVFKTGDLGTYRADMLSISGRRDTQVKIMGHKVDLAAVEAALNHCAGVAISAVQAIRDQSDNTVLAALVVARGRVPAATDLRQQLAAGMPGYMIPARINFVESLPLTPNGKIDRRRLTGATASSAAATAEPERASNPLEQTLRQIWSEALGMPRVDADQDFWELGGTSLQAAAIMAEISSRLALDLPISTLLQAPTTSALARHIDRLESVQWPLLVPLQRGGAKPPLFIIPGAGSDVLSMEHLVRRLPDDQPVYGLQHRGHDGRSLPHASLEAIATEFLREVRQLQPRGPHLLAGSSFGGIVAYEMAQQLRRDGMPPALLAIIDARAPGGLRPRPDLGPLARLRLRWRPLLPQVNQDSYGFRNLRRGLKERWWRYRAQWLHEHLPSLRLPTAWRYHLILDVHARLRRRYRPLPYEEAVILFRSESRSPPDLYERDETLGWGALARQLEIMDIPGRHGPHLRPPNVYVLAERLGSAIGRVIG